jgi:hypothetical protein
MTICTAPHAQVAEASSSLDHPSLVRPWSGKASGFSAAVDIVIEVRGGCLIWCMVLSVQVRERRNNDSGVRDVVMVLIPSIYPRYTDPAYD